jgi:hemerythrin-like domain-containing protein
VTNPLDERARPHAPAHPDAEPTPRGLRSAQALVQIHDHFRDELQQIRNVVDQVASGHGDAAAARSLINRMTMRQNFWSVGAFCASYCRLLALHHTIEDEHVFPELAALDAELKPVLHRLSEEHEIIADALTRLDLALVAMVADPESIDQVDLAVDHLGEILLSHLAYEETELLGPIGRLGLEI